MAIYELDQAIKIDDNFYNINAVKADSVKSTLDIYKVNLGDTEDVPSTTKVLSFNGKDTASLALVTAEGGRFRGRIKVPNNTNKTIDAEAVLNYSDIKDVVLTNIKNNAIVYNWDGSTIDSSFDNAINSISIVQGPEAKASAFASYNKSQYDAYIKEKTENGSSIIKYLPTYLYVGTKENKVYYGTADKNTAELLAINGAGVVAEAAKLVTPRNIKVDLGSTAIVSFDGTKDIDGSTSDNPAPGVTGVLAMANGGLGGNISSNNSTAKTAEYYINGAINETTAAVTDNTQIICKRETTSESAGFCERKKASILWNYIANKIRSTFGFNSSNVLPVANGGTGQTSLDNVTVGISKKIKTTMNGTDKNSTIMISTNPPADGLEGDIWIVYKNS
jgi:hypothetical protein